MKYLEMVRATAQRLKLVKDDGNLRKLDSLAIVDFVLALEQDGKMSIPTASLRQENFTSVEEVARMLEDLE